jgi:hypothetical protein
VQNKGPYMNTGIERLFIEHPCRLLEENTPKIV